MDPALWQAVVIICAIGATWLAAGALRKRSTATRAVVAVLAVAVVAGSMNGVRTLVEKARFSTDDDFAWSEIHRIAAARYPAIGDVWTLSPAIEQELRSALLPVMRNRDLPTSAKSDASAIVIAGVLQKHVFPVATHGLTEAINAWGSANARLLREFAAISVEACADFAMTSIVRHATNKEISALLGEAHRALINAYRTSDSSKYPLPAQDAVNAQYTKALRVAQPPFSDEELEALDALEKEPKEVQCRLTLRLLEAIERLDRSSKAIIFRNMMKKD